MIVRYEFVILLLLFLVHALMFAKMRTGHIVTPLLTPARSTFLRSSNIVEHSALIFSITANY
jgi:hypothetical protein